MLKSCLVGLLFPACFMATKSVLSRIDFRAMWMILKNVLVVLLLHLRSGCTSTSHCKVSKDLILKFKSCLAQISLFHSDFLFCSVILFRILSMKTKSSATYWKYLFKFVFCFDNNNLVGKIKRPVSSLSIADISSIFQIIRLSLLLITNLIANYNNLTKATYSKKKFTEHYFFREIQSFQLMFSTLSDSTWIWFL